MRNVADLPAVTVLATGGTIAGCAAAPGSVTDYESGVLAAGTLLDAVPQLAGIAEITCRQIANIGSEHMTEKVWRDLASAVAAEAARGEADGIVILHGTDTMEETAFFLDCVLAGAVATLPVVLTGAMLPADALSADGPANILNAVRVAADPSAAGRGVLVQFANTIHAAARVYKADALALDAFRSTPPGPVGEIIDGAVRFFNEYACGEWPDVQLDVGDFSAASAASPLPGVGILYGHAGMDGGVVSSLLDAAGWRGIVYAGVGMGNIHDAVRPVLLDAVRRGMPVVCSTRIDGTLAVLRPGDMADGFVCAHRLNPQKARVLLQLALLGGISAERVQSVFDVYAD